MVLPSFAPSALPHPWYKSRTRISDELKDLAHQEAQIEEEKNELMRVGVSFPIPGAGSFNETRDDYLDLRRTDLLRGLGHAGGSPSPIVVPNSDAFVNGFSDDLNPL